MKRVCKDMVIAEKCIIQVRQESIETTMLSSVARMQATLRNLGRRRDTDGFRRLVSLQYRSIVYTPTQCDSVVSNRINVYEAVMVDLGVTEKWPPWPGATNATRCHVV